MRSRSLTILPALLLCAAFAFAQGTTSTATGVVTDPTGAIVPGATVVLTNQGTSYARTVQTTSAGLYVFDAIPVGDYSISVAKTGFRTFRSRNNVVTIGQPMTVNVKLRVGTASQEVSVNASAELVQTSSSGNFGNIVNQRTIQQLPIVGTRGRNPLDLDVFQPGVITGGNTGGGVNVNGSRGRAWNFTLDGIAINEASAPGSNYSPVNTNPDSIGEFRVITSNLTAQYGSVSGGQVAMITRQGTNQFHGEGFWLYQTPGLNANNYFNNLAGLGRSDFVQNIYGFSVGGPIIKNRTFFFTNLQLLHAHESEFESSPVFTSQARQGLFRYVPNSQNTPYGQAGASVNADGSVASGVQVNTYNVATENPGGLALDPTLQKIIGLTPLPNDFSSGDGLNIAGFDWTPNETQSNADWTLRVDQILNTKNALFLRWYQSHDNTIADIVNGGLPPFPKSPNVVNTYREPKSLALGWTASFSPNLTNQLVAGFTHYIFNFANPDPNFRSNPPYDLAIVSNPLQNYVGNARAISTPQLNDDLTWLHGAHTIQTGVHLEYVVHIDDRGSIGGWDAEPYINFDPGINTVSSSAFKLPSDINKSTDLGNLKTTINDLLGRVGTMGQGFVSNQSGSAYQPGGSIFNFEAEYPQYEFYGQDAWRLNPNLVLDYGLRWDVMLAPHDPRHRILRPNQSFTVGAAPTNTLAWAPGPLYKNSNTLLAPTVGFAWDPFGHGTTSVRAHYGLYYDPINTFSISSGVFEHLVGLNYGVTNDSFGESGGLLRNGLPALAPPAGLTPEQLRQPPAFSRSSVTAMDPNWHPAQVSEWGLSVEHELPQHMVLTVQFIGKHAVHLYGGYNANQVNVTSNGFLQAFKTVQSGGDSSLMDQLLSADPHVAKGQTGSQYVRDAYSGDFALNSVGALADSLSKFEVKGMGLAQASGLSPYFFLPLPQFAGGFDVLDSNDWSHYNALQIQMQRRFGGLTFQASYSLAKSMDTRSYDPTFTRVRTGHAQSASSTPYDIYNRSLNYAPSDFDQRHALQGDWVWNLPFGAGQRWGSGVNPWLRHVIGGWTTAAVLTWTSGRPFSAYSGAYTFDGDVQSFANCAGSCSGLASLHTDPKTGNRTLFTPQQIAQFSTPALGQLGNTGRNFFRLPEQFDLDLDLAKEFHITESQRLEIRADATNVTNHPGYDLADSSTITSSVFGSELYGVANTERRIQLGLKYYF